jgi:hypothetical protein
MSVWRKVLGFANPSKLGLVYGFGEGVSVK